MKDKSGLVKKLEDIFYQDTFTVIPEKLFPAQDYGAKADGKTVSTGAIQAAIDAANAAGGGIVTLTCGVTVCGALFIKSNVELRLDEGVVLQAVHDDTEYPDLWTRVAGIEMNWPAALINIYGVENVRVTGKGVIDGNGSYWWNKFNRILEPYMDKGLRWAADYAAKRVRPIVVYQSNNILLKNFTVKRSGFWTVSLTYSNRVHVDAITIRNNVDGHGPSTDGIDVDSSNLVLIENCDIDCNDDNFCLKSGRDYDGLRVNRPVEDVIVRNCIAGKGSGLITIGSETSGGFNNIEVYGLKSKGTYNGIRIKSAKIRGGVIQNIWFHDIKMEDVNNPFHWELNWLPSYSYPPLPKNIPESKWPVYWEVMLAMVTPSERGIPEVHNIKVSDVTALRAEIGFYANAYKEKLVQNIHWENITIDATKSGSISNAKDWTMTNVVLHSKNQVGLYNCTNVQLPLLKITNKAKKYQ